MINNLLNLVKLSKMYSALNYASNNSQNSIKSLSHLKFQNIEIYEQNALIEFKHQHFQT